jgi:hypothetical protein
MATLQAQGVPWKNRLGPTRNRQPQIKNQYIRTRTKTPEGGSRTVTTHYAAPAPSRQRYQRPTPRQYNPANAGSQVTGSIGALEGEFIVCLALLGLLMFANTGSSYGEKIMSLMKRGTLVCLLFFLLAIISNIGPNAEKIAKAFGGLVIVAILLTSPINTVITDVDSLIKNDWVGTSETGGDYSSASAATQANANRSAVSAAEQAAINAGLPGQLAALLPTNLLQGLGSAGEKGVNAVKNFFRGFLP